MAEQTAEQNMEMWFTHTKWVWIMNVRNRNREAAKKGGLPMFTGDRHNITTREEDGFVVIRLRGFNAMNPHHPALPGFIWLAADRVIDLRTNLVIKERGNSHAMQ